MLLLIVIVKFRHSIDFNFYLFKIMQIYCIPNFFYRIQSYVLQKLYTYQLVFSSGQSHVFQWRVFYLTQETSEKERVRVCKNEGTTYTRKRLVSANFLCFTLIHTKHIFQTSLAIYTYYTTETNIQKTCISLADAAGASKCQEYSRWK